MKFRLSVDDNIWFLKDIASNCYPSIFDNPYLAVYRRLHAKYGTKVQLNLFYETEGFDLSQMPDRYKNEWEENAHWLKLSFHSKKEFPERPYQQSGYQEVYEDCMKIHNEIKRFAGEQSLNLYTTVHFCQASKEAVAALYDAGIRGLVGLFGTPEKPRYSYGLKYEKFQVLYEKPYFYDDDTKMYFLNNHMVINTYPKLDIIPHLSAHIGRPFIEIMIHEQYFYPHYAHYQPDFEEKLELAVSYLVKQGYQSIFLDELLPMRQ